MDDEAIIKKQQSRQPRRAFPGGLSGTVRPRHVGLYQRAAFGGRPQVPSEPVAFRRARPGESLLKG